MKRNKVIRKKRVGTVVSSEEYEVIKSIFRSSAYRSFSNYVRKMLLAQPISLKYGNASIDPLIDQLIGLRNNIEATLEHPSLSDEDKSLLKTLFSEIKILIIKIADICLQK